ncbi:glycoside hydrolase family 172 protein [Actinomyces sp. F1_1611]
MSLDLTRPSSMISRAITAENFRGVKAGGGRATDGFSQRAASRLGVGWKVSPCVEIAPSETFEVAEIEGPGLIQHLWFTCHYSLWRSLMLRIHWDGEQIPAVEVPLGDFFCNGWEVFSQVSSTQIAANPHGGFNSYWQMPFHRSARITIENLSSVPANLYYQVDYALGEIPADSLYFHAQWNRSNPVPDGIHPLLPRVEGTGRYVGAYLAWQSNSPGWWGEGEVKIYLDGDEEYPTICGTGTEDYFGGAWNFDIPSRGYTEFTTPYLGLNQVLKPDGLYQSQQRFGMYRWHVVDSIGFNLDLRIEIQALGIGPGQGNGLPHRYRKLKDDIASTALFYLDRPAVSAHERPQVPDLLTLEVQ